MEIHRHKLKNAFMRFNEPFELRAVLVHGKGQCSDGAVAIVNGHRKAKPDSEFRGLFENPMLCFRCELRVEINPPPKGLGVSKSFSDDGIKHLIIIS